MSRQTVRRRVRRLCARRSPRLVDRRRAVVSLGGLGAVVLRGFAPAGASAASSTVLASWGANELNGLGNVGNVDSPTQLTTAGVSDATAASTGQEISLILTPAGVYATGNDVPTKFGTTSYTPTLIANTAGTTAVAAGHDGSLLLEGGTVYAFGENNYGTAGGTIGEPVEVPTPVAGLPGDITAISAGASSGLALDAQGNIWAWGQAATLGSAAAETGGNTATPVEVPLPAADVAAGAHAVAISAGGEFDLALLSDGNVISWGENGSGELGIGGTGSGTEDAEPTETTYDTNDVLGPSGLGSPTTLPSGVAVTSVSAGGGPGFGVALLSNGSFESWGNNGVGALGLGTGNEYTVLSPEAPNPNQLANFPTYPAFTALQAENESVFGLTASGQVYAWGGNAEDELALNGGMPTYEFPYTGAPGTGEYATEIPNEVTGALDVPWLTSGSAGSAQFVQTGQPLSLATGSQPNFFSHQLGTLSATQEVNFVANTATTITGVGITPSGSGDADDFLVVPENGTPLEFPVNVSDTGATVYSVLLRFAPSHLGDEEATLNVYTTTGTVAVPLTGYGVELTGTPGSNGATGPAGSNGTNGSNGGTGPAGSAGKNGTNGKNGVVVFAAEARKASIKPGHVATLRFALGNGTTGGFPKTSLSVSAPKGLDLRGSRSATVASLGAGKSRTVTLRLRAGAKARRGTYKVKVTWKLGGRTVTRSCTTAGELRPRGPAAGSGFRWCPGPVATVGPSGPGGGLWLLKNNITKTVFFIWISINCRP
jgi:alpha-tubulin suppressor-like RCC1 family protein